MGQTPVLWGLRDKHLPSAGSGPRPFCHLSVDKLHKLFIHQAPGRPHSSFKSKPSKPRFISTHCVSRTRGPATLAVPCATQRGRWLAKFSVPREIIAWLWDSRVQNLIDRSFFLPLSSGSALVHFVQINSKSTNYKVQLKKIKRILNFVVSV